MITSLNNGQFFSEYEIDRLQELGIWKESHTTPEQLAFAALILSPLMQVDMQDTSTSTSEFNIIEEFIEKIESDFEIAREEDIESIGMEMGLLPMVKGTWDDEKFLTARALLAGALERLTEREANHVRNALAKAVLDVARAGSGHIISLHHITRHEKPLLHAIVQELRLHTTGEGLHLLDQTEV